MDKVTLCIEVYDDLDEVIVTQNIEATEESAKLHAEKLKKFYGFGTWVRATYGAGCVKVFGKTVAFEV